MKWENTYVVFDVSKGPSVMIEKLNSMGEEGWECCSMLNVATTKIVAFMKRAEASEAPVNKEEEKISKLWSGE